MLAFKAGVIRQGTDSACTCSRHLCPSCFYVRCSHCVCFLAGRLVFKKGGDVVYSYGEKDFGDHAPMDEVLAAAQKAGSS